MTALLDTPTAPAAAASAAPGHDVEVRTVPFSRRVAVVGLVAGSVLNLTEALLVAPLGGKPETVEEGLRGVAENTALYGARAVIGTLAVPFLLIGLLAACRLLAARARRTGRAAAALLTAGMWGFLGLHLLSFIDIPMSQGGDLAERAELLTSLQSTPWLAALVLVPFLVGTALGMLVLTVGLLRTGAVARWIGATWLAFLVLDFGVQSGVGPVDPHWLFVAGAFGLALHVRRMTDRAWANA